VRGARDPGGDGTRSSRSGSSSRSASGCTAPHDLFAVFEARIVSGEPAVQEKEEVVVELEWVDPEEAGRRMPWYPGGIRGLARGRAVYYADRGDQPSTE